MKTRKMIMFTGAAIMAAGMMAGCGSNTKETTAAPTTAAPTTAAETTKETAAEAEKPGTQNTADSSKTKDKKKETVFFMA